MISPSDQKPVTELYPYIRRICDLTTPNLMTQTISGRSENRYNRAIPTLLSPWKRDQPVVEGSTICLTCDLSDRGVGLVLSKPSNFEKVLIGYWIPSTNMPEPWFFIGEVKRTHAMGGGFWALGVELTELSSKQASYIGVSTEGPYKPSHYRY